MKLKQGFITHNTGNESILVPTGSAEFAGLVRGNKTLGAILDLLKQETDEASVIAAMCARFDAPEERIAADVRAVLSALRKVEALDE